MVLSSGMEVTWKTGKSTMTCCFFALFYEIIYAVLQKVDLVATTLDFVSSK